MGILQYYIDIWTGDLVHPSVKPARFVKEWAIATIYIIAADINYGQ